MWEERRRGSRRRRRGERKRGGGRRRNEWWLCIQLEKNTASHERLEWKGEKGGQGKKSEGMEEEKKRGKNR